MGRDALIDYYENSQLYGVGYWAGTPHGTNIYQGLHDDIFPNLNPTVHEKYLLLDFSDLKKKTLDEIAELPALLQGFEDYLHVVLLMNDNELTVFHQALTGNTEICPDVPFDAKMQDTAAKLAQVPRNLWNYLYCPSFPPICNIGQRPRNSTNLECLYTPPSIYHIRGRSFYSWNWIWDSLESF